MREVVRDMIERQEDMEVVGEVSDPLDLLMAVRETEADAVIVALMHSEGPGLCSHLLAEYPNLTILALVSTGEAAFVEQLCPRRREIVEPSELNVLSALRYAVRAPCSSDEEVKK